MFLTRRSYHQCSSLWASPLLAKPTYESNTSKKRSDKTESRPLEDYTKSKPAELKQTPIQRAAAAAERAKAAMQKQQAGAGKPGGLASNSLFADQSIVKEDEDPSKQDVEQADSGNFSGRNHGNMQRILNPRPWTRLRWQRKMVIQQIRRRGRLTKEMKLARTERAHLSKSHFFKTSVKKLMLLARQIAGKSIDEAILQMRFSKKKAARDIREHLIQARDEAIVMRGMGLGSPSVIEMAQQDGLVKTDAAETPPSREQNPDKTRKYNVASHETDIYIAQAWVNRGPYGKEPEYRARGRVNILRPPHTGISVLLKEEKTRTREASEKQEKEIRRRMGKNMWTQLPDRKITRQSQYLLW